MTYRYKVDGVSVELEVDPSVIAVRFGVGPTSWKAKALDNAGVGPFSDRIDLVGEGLSIIPAAGMAGPLGWPVADEQANLIALLRDEEAVTDAVPVFRFGTTQAVPTDRIIFGAEPDAKVEPILSRHDLRLVSRREERVVAQIPIGADVFAVVNAVDSDEDTLYAEPDFVMVGRHMPARAHGPSSAHILTASGQYALAITKAGEAWKVHPGTAAIRVAILDEGVDTAHPDLAPAIAATYDAIDDDSYQEPNNWDGHGTACAGLAAASPASVGGVAGTGKGCGLVAVRIAYSDRPEGPWQTRQATIAAGIDWAWRQGKASVISNSWGQQLPTNAVVHAIARARTEGRDGLGCVIVVAAGNSGGAVLFPASLPDVLTVAASNEYDEAKTATSADGETFWASCRGPEIDVAAPGVHNLTTDIRGSGGYAPGSYAPAFNGTSSATPLVAGACALLLSKRPDLREAQVRQVIVATADKVGQFPYATGRNDYMGNGRLNILAAISAI